MSKGLLFIKNTLSVDTRSETLDGRDYLVVPSVMIIEGVHNGSQGPLFYSNGELAKFVCCWNMKPALLRHPDVEKSGTDLDILKNQGFGMLMNTEFTDGKLKTEVWIDVEKANKLDSRIISRIENGETVEVSTGLFAEFDQVAGVWNNEDYVSSALNYRPDHLAILLDATGACSVEDGAGLLKNKKGVKNEASHGIIRDQLDRLIRAEFSEKYPWVMDVYSNYFIYEVADKFYRQDYAVSSDDVVSLVGDSVEVVRDVSYKTVTTQNQEVDVERDVKIAALIANKQFKTDDKEFLDSLTDDQLDKLTVNAEVEEEVVAPKEGAEEGEAVENKEVVLPAGSQVVANSVKENNVTAEDYLAKAPAEIQAVLNSGLALLNKKKTDAIEIILANEANSFTKELLDGKSLEEVEMIAKLAQNAKAPVVAEKPAVVETVENTDEVPSLQAAPTLYASQPVGTVTNSDDDVPSLRPIPLFKETK